VRLPTTVERPVPGPSRLPSVRPRLVLVSSRRTTAGRLPFLIVVGGVLVLGLVAVLLLHTLAAQDAFRANAMQQRLSALTDRQQQLAGVVDADSAPGALRARAAGLGMVPTAVDSYRRLHDGRTVGVQTPAYVPPPAPIVTHSSTPTAAKTAKKSATSKAATTTSGSKHAGATGKAGRTSPKHHHHPAQP
jgi:hypothetical protein